MSAFLELDRITKSFTTRPGERIEVLRDLSLTIDEHEVVTLLGPNGCGKSTLLNIIAGLLAPDAGSVQIGGRSPADASVGFVFQNSDESLLPWRSALDNIALPLELQGVDVTKRRQIVTDYAARLGVRPSTLDLSAFPYQLSGGQRQLVSILRAFITEPEVLLLDEPFGHLDYMRRLIMQQQFAHMLRRQPTTVVFVSHDVEEAVHMGDRIVLLSARPGTILDVHRNIFARRDDEEPGLLLLAATLKASIRAAFSEVLP